MKWRSDSFLDDHGMTEDGQRVDLSGGYYDAGDTIKFGFPLAYTMTILAWGGLEFYESYEKINELGGVSNKCFELLNSVTAQQQIKNPFQTTFYIR